MVPLLALLIGVQVFAGASPPPAAAAAWVARAGKHKPRPKAPPPPAAAPKAAPAPVGTSIEILSRARALVDELEYDGVVQLTSTLLRRDDLTADQRVEVLVLRGTALAIVADITDAEGPFRALLQQRPDFELPGDTPPKVVAAFRRVQVEERSRRAQEHEAERRGRVARMSLRGDEPREVAGGTPITFGFELTDPSQSVTSVQVLYRKAGDGDFSSLALAGETGGRWIGEIPGELTENDNGLDFQWFLRTSDASGEALLELGNSAGPNLTHVLPGRIERASPFYRTWWFWTATAVAIVGAGVAAYVIIDRAHALPDSDIGPVTVP